MSQERGSKKLQANWHKQNISLTETDVEKVAHLIDHLGLELYGWHRKGQPAFDGLSAEFLVKNDAMAEFIQQYQLIESPHLVLHWHPIGVPQIDGHLIKITTEGEE